VIGMDMGVQDEPKPEPGALRGSKVELRIAHGIDDGARCLAAATEQVGDPDRIGVQELSEDHGLRSPPAGDTYIQSIC